MESILAAIGKLRGCVRQIENLNPNSAFEQDILNRAKVLLAQDKNYNKGFKFDHVWPILKDIEKNGDDHSIATPYFRGQNSEFVSSQSDSLAPESPTSASPGLSSFSLNINDEYVDDCSTQRPIGVKNAKGKRKVEDQNSLMVTYHEENKILLKDLNSISDLSLRQYFQNEQIKILQRRSQQDQASQNTFNNIGQYFDDIGGSNNDLPHY
ncbi:hypothetical protein CICLE_v10027215mg [Citrus x clementina]|uniref:No apical meristem-associated C-terminal domain-containing protein n=1 Tax=Citrus clementina TaxID=85681 RepID=V4S206_CITCL|nr:hypothetical protein CICLE_v10027215mg [Citrus x clementina]